MKKIAVISSSVRDGRLSHRVALYMKDLVARTTDAECEIIDLKEYAFPLFPERFMNLSEPESKVRDYAKRIKEADGVIIVSPVYNASFPAALKNAVDLLFVEWRRKPVAIVTVTYGTTPGIATSEQLQSLMLKLGSRVAAPVYTVINAGTDFSENGIPVNQAVADKFAGPLVDELMWIIKAGELTAK